MVRLLLPVTVMPFVAFSVYPSARMRCTLPVTVTRSEMVTLLFTTYQPPPGSLPVHVLLVLSTTVALSQVCSWPFSSKYFTLVVSANGLIPSLAGGWGSGAWASSTVTMMVGRVTPSASA